MATDGAPRASVIKGSDEFYPFLCSNCSRKEIDVGAEVYCTQCEEYMCGKCHSNHNSFVKMASHTMLDRAQMEAQGPQRPQPVPTVQSPLTVPCDLHPGERYTLFCGKHNQVCCAVCSRVNHKSCDVRYILDVTNKAMQGPELNEFRRAVKETQARLEKVKKRRELDLQRMTTEKDTEINKIRESIQQMVTHLQTIEKTAVNDVTRKFTEYKTKIEKDLTDIATVINSLNTKLDQLEKANDDTEKFIHMKIGAKDKSSAKKTIEEIETHVGEEKLEFLIDWRFDESIKKLQSLGHLSRYTVTLEGQHSVDTKKDKNVCNTMDICLNEDGGLLMTDWNNQCLKRFDHSHRFIDRLKFDNKPKGVCLVSANQLAVSLPYSKSVVLVELKSTMSKSASFKTTDRCKGITYHADHLYIGCGGDADWGEGPGHIAVYNISGTLVRKLETDSRGKLFSSSPVGVVMRRNDDVILVCDRNKGLVALRPDGQRLWTLTFKDLGVIDVAIISMDGHGQALVSSVSSNKVVLVSRDGRKLDEVLTARDGIKHPRALCYDQQQCRLIVGMHENNQFSVFKLA